jgi:hypothetical protein
MVQKIHPRGVIWVPSNSPHDVHLNWNSGARSLSSSKACPCIIAGCWVWMLYKKPTLQSKQGQQRICCDMWFLCNLLKNLYKTCFQNHLIKKNLEIHENKSHDWEIWRTIISDLGCFRRKGNLSKQATKNK